MLIAIVACIATVDTGAEGTNAPFLLPTFGVIQIPDLLAGLLLIFAGSRLGPGKLAAISSQPVNIAVVIFVMLLLAAVRGYFVDLPHGGVVGPEARGLFFYSAISILTCLIVVCDPASLTPVFTVALVASLFRILIDVVFFGGLTDGAQGALAACMAVLLQACALQGKGRYRLLIVPAVLLDLAIVSSTRRTPMLVLFTGTLLTFLVLIWSRKTPHSTKVLAVLLPVILAGTGAALDATVLSGQISDRLKSIDLNESNAKGTSNYEHRNDFEDSFNLVMDAPLLGYGTGTELPGRSLGQEWGGMIPIHSPHLHSWARLGIAGLIGYLILEFMPLYYLFRLYLSRQTMQKYGMECGAMCLALAAFFLAQNALPPFYLDPKQGFIVGLLTGAMFGLLRRYPLEKEPLKSSSFALHSKLRKRVGFSSISGY